MLEVYSGNPPAAGSAPIYIWPMEASATLSIDTLSGNDEIFVELSADSDGPTAGVRFERGAATDELHVQSGRLRFRGGTRVLASVSIDVNAAIDIGESALVIDYTGTSPTATVREKIRSGRGGAGVGASWNGVGITSSTAAAANAAEPERWSVGYAENAFAAAGSVFEFPRRGGR
jgi:hypothetical protein